MTNFFAENDGIFLKKINRLRGTSGEILMSFILLLNPNTVNAIPCIVSSDTVETDTNPTARGQVNTNNNSLNNNIKDK